MTELRTDRLLLRRARHDDAEALHRVLGDRKAMTYWSTPPHADLAATEAWVESMIESPASLSEDFVVVEDGVPIGKIGAWRLPEFGFVLRPDRWGRPR